MQAMAEAGLLQATTKDIARRAGVAHGTVFAHFRTREDLLCAVIEELGARVTGRLHQLASGDHGLLALLEAHVQGLIENERLYTRLVAERSGIPKRAQYTLVMIQSAVSFHLSATLDRESRQAWRGSRPPELWPLHLMFNTWIGLLHHYLLQADLFAPGEPSVLRQHGPTLARYFHALVADERKV